MQEPRHDRLTPADLEAAVGLSTEAGWNQTSADWQRLLELVPEGCLAARVDGRLVATATVVGYPAGVKWVGMVLVAGAYRQRGIGTSMLRAALAVAGEGVVGLDATELGRPLYLAHGFADVAAIDRWVGRLTALALSPPLAALGQDNLEQALVLDRAAVGVDRAALLAHLAGAGASWVVRDPDSDRLVGLACLRPGREHAHLGPVVAKTEPALQTLLGAAAQRLGGGSVLVDAPRSAATTALLEAHGLVVQRRLTRMTRPGRQGILMGDSVAAATAFEWG